MKTNEEKIAEHIAPSEPHFLDGVPKLEDCVKAKTTEGKDVYVVTRHKDGFDTVSVDNTLERYEWYRESELTPLPSLVPWDQKDFLTWLAKNGMDDVWFNTEYDEEFKKVGVITAITIRSDVGIYHFECITHIRKGPDGEPVKCEKEV